MSRSIDPSFYKTKAWQTTRELYLKSVDGLCERCLAQGIYKPAEHVHHKIHLNAENINNPKITYGYDNLEALCLECHNKEHFRKNDKRYTFDKDGNVICKELNDDNIQR